MSLLNECKTRSDRLIDPHKIKKTIVSKEKIDGDMNTYLYYRSFMIDAYQQVKMLPKQVQNMNLRERERIEDCDC
jgi:hypothetical protein